MTTERTLADIVEDHQAHLDAEPNPTIESLQERLVDVVDGYVGALRTAERLRSEGQRALAERDGALQELETQQLVTKNAYIGQVLAIAVAAVFAVAAVVSVLI